jgi:hypothetical protein
MTPSRPAQSGYPQAMKAMLALTLALAASPAFADGSEETALLAVRSIQGRAEARSEAGLLREREEAVARSAARDCEGRGAGCGRQVSAQWVAGRQANVAAQAIERAMVSRYGLEGWGRELLSDTDTPAELTMAAAAGALWIAADGLRASKTISGLRLRLEVASARSFADKQAQLAKIELGTKDGPLTLTAAYTRRAPFVGAAYRLRY